MPSENSTNTPAAPAPAATPQPRTSLLAIASLIFAILWVPCLLAIICGHLARGAVKRSAGALTGGGIALFGLILGYLGLFVGIIVIAAGAFFWGHTADIRADLAAGRDPTGSIVNKLSGGVIETYLKNEEKLPAPVREKINTALDESTEPRLALIGSWMLQHARASGGRLPDTLAQIGQNLPKETTTPTDASIEGLGIPLPAQLDTKLLLPLLAKHLVIIPGLNTGMPPETVVLHSEKPAPDGTLAAFLLDGTTVRLDPADPRRAKLTLKKP